VKKTVKRVVHFCDSCGKEADYPYMCLGCKIEYCYDCEKKLMVEYQHAVNFRGSEDGYFCLKCSVTPPLKVRNLFYAYHEIAKLIAEAKSWSKEFDSRVAKAEETVKQEIRKAR